MEIKGFQKTSFIDFPHYVAAIIWTGGCNFRCPFCYNKEIVLNPTSLPTIPEEEVFNYLENQRVFLDGLVVSGGEPTLQPDLIPFLIQVKEKGFLVKVDTNGSQPEIIAEMLRRKAVDYLALDFKAPLNPVKYALLTGTSRQSAKAFVKKVHQTVDLLLNTDVQYEIRTTVVPGMLEEEDLLEIGRFFQRQGGGRNCAPRYALQNFFPAETLDPACGNLTPWEKERVLTVAERLKPFFREVIVRSR